MSLRDDIAADIESVFLGEDGFGDRRVIEGREMRAVFYDEEILLENPEYGLATRRWVLQVSTADLEYSKKSGATLEIDGRLYLVETWREELGICVISLTAKQ